jgi:aspartate racemase
MRFSKTIGVIGGMGPESTADFYMEMIRFCQRNYNAKYDDDFPRIIIYSLPIPDVVESLKNPDEIMLRVKTAIRVLEQAGADFIAIPCNTMHCFIEDFRSFSKIPIISIAEETTKKLVTKNINKAGILGTELTLKKQIYKRITDANRINLIEPTKEQQRDITRIIMNILSGNIAEADRQSLVEIIYDMKNKGAQTIILACTDLPLIISQCNNIELINTTNILAESVIQMANED